MMKSDAFLGLPQVRKAAAVLAVVICAHTAFGEDVPKADEHPAADRQTPPLFTQVGSDPGFASLRESGVFAVGRNTRDGVKGSVIHVNRTAVEAGEGGKHPIPADIRIHTLCNSSIPRKDFAKWSRWYQEDGHTQVFRLFAGETNVRNDRQLAARIEAFSALKWQTGAWHEWSGSYTIVRPHDCAIFQVKNTKNDWGVMIRMSESGEIKLGHRRHKENDRILAKNMTGKRFDLRVRDNGRDYEVYFNGQKAGTGSYERPEGDTCFRWGMYLGETEVRHDAMIFVTGARFQ